MRVAIPAIGNRLSSHFGRSESFWLIDIDPVTKSVIRQEKLPAPVQGHAMLARWLLERGTDIVIAGGIGRRALEKFEKCSIKVKRVAITMKTDEIVQSLIDDTLPTGEMPCERGDGNCGRNNHGIGEFSRTFKSTE